MSGVAALYVHVPFCASKCLYCDFDSRACRDGAAFDAYSDAMGDCLGLLAREGVLLGCETAYVGGGTPSVLGQRLVRIVQGIRSAAPGLSEISCEANPESMSSGLACELAAAGATRVSLGVQSIDDAELRAVGRLHTARRAVEAVGEVMASGLDVSCDLMCGLPGQTAASWERSVSSVLGLGVRHLSVYPLALEEGTPLERAARRDPALEPDEDFQAACMERARDLCRDAGLLPYEVASYAEPGRACRHNAAYWTGKNYLGLGRSAASMLDRATYERLRGALRLPAVSDGCARVRFVQAGDELPPHASWDVEELDEREAAAEDLMLGMRLNEGVSAELLERAGSVLGRDRVERAVLLAVGEGLARWEGDGGRLVPTHRGWLMGNELFGIMWDLAR